jgi:hypothetical protein
MEDWDKTDIIRFLSAHHGYRSYLEICTPTTGNLFAKIRQADFAICHRLMYRCSEDFDDGHPIDFRTPDFDTGELIAARQASDHRYDVILVDSFHLYDTSYRDIADALSLLSDHGTIVVHDCLPTSEDLVSSDFRPGFWCGVTFVAYVDFVHAVGGIAHATVDADFGCGIIRRSARQAPPLPPGWNVARTDALAAYRFLREHPAALLNLMSVDDFCRAELARASSGSPGRGHINGDGAGG